MSLEKRARKELEEIGYPVSEEAIEVMVVIFDDHHSLELLSDINKLKIAVEIATTNLGVNSSEALQQMENGRYRRVWRAFTMYRREMWPGKITWQKALKKMGIKYVGIYEKWNKEKFLKYLKKHGIRSHKELTEHSKALGFYKRNAKKLGKLKDLIIAAGLEPVNSRIEGRRRRAERERRERELTKKQEGIIARRAELKKAAAARAEERRKMQEARENTDEWKERERIRKMQEACEHDRNYRYKFKCGLCGKRRRRR